MGKACGIYGGEKKCVQVGKPEGRMPHGRPKD
jgi:hypothetical protein